MSMDDVGRGARELVQRGEVELVPMKRLPCDRLPLVVLCPMVDMDNCKKWMLLLVGLCWKFGVLW